MTLATPKFKLLCAFIVLTSLIAGSNKCRHIGAKGDLLTTALNKQKTTINLFQVPEVFARQKGMQTLADVAERCVKSVVNISFTKVIKMKEGKYFSPFFNDPFFKHFFGEDFFFSIPKERREKSLGSGVVISTDGLILTNNHVVENAEEIVISLGDKKRYKGEIVGTDPKSDVAVIKIKGKAKDLTPIPFGDSSKLRLGDVVLAIGNPFGLSHTVTMGIVSAKGRANIGIADYEDFIQTDAAINPGNSGGALVNLKGQLVGINTAIISRTGGYQGIGFAIPSNMAKSVMESLLKYGKVIRGWLGVMIQEVTQDIADAMQLDSTKGVLISDVMKNSPAEKAGLKRGDVILKLNGEETNSTSQLRNLVASTGAGKGVTLLISRKGKKMEVKVTLGEVPQKQARQLKVEKEESAIGGITVSELTDKLRDKYSIPSQITGGVVITSIEPDSPARMAGLRRGDVIIEVNNTKVTSVEQFKKMCKKGRNKILLLVYRERATFYVVLSK